MKLIMRALVTLLLFVPMTAQAAISRVGTQFAANPTTSASATTLTYTLPAGVGSGNALVGMVTWDCSGSTTVTTVSDNQGNSYSVGTQYKDTGNGQCAKSFWRGNITNAPTVVTVTFSGSSPWRGGVMQEYTGVAALNDPSDGNIGQYQNGPGTGANAITTTAVTTTQAGDMIIGMMECTNGSCATITAGTGFTINSNLTASNDWAYEDQLQASAGSIAATFTQTGPGVTVSMLVAIKASGGSPPAGGTRRSMTGVGK